MNFSEYAEVGEFHLDIYKTGRREKYGQYLYNYTLDFLSSPHSSRVEFWGEVTTTETKIEQIASDVLVILAEGNKDAKRRLSKKERQALADWGTTLGDYDES